MKSKLKKFLKRRRLTNEQRQFWRSALAWLFAWGLIIGALFLIDHLAGDRAAFLSVWIMALLSLAFEDAIIGNE